MPAGGGAHGESDDVAPWGRRPAGQRGAGLMLADLARRIGWRGVTLGAAAEQYLAEMRHLASWQSRRAEVRAWPPQAQSIRQDGILQPLLVRPTRATAGLEGERYEIWRKRLGVEPSPPAQAGSDRF